VIKTLVLVIKEKEKTNANFLIYILSSQWVFENLFFLWLPTYFPACSLFQSEFVLCQEAICYINIFFTRKNILKSPIHFDQMVVLFDLHSWKCVFNKDKRYSLILGGCVSRDPITPSYTLREARINF
jgi:hypothetical protein